MHMLIVNPLLFTLDWWNATCFSGHFLYRPAILLSWHHIRKEYYMYHYWVEKTKKKNTDCRRKPAELTMLTKINSVTPTNMNLLLNLAKAKAARRNFQSTWFQKFLILYILRFSHQILLCEKAFQILFWPIREAKRVSHMWKNHFVQSQTTV